MRDRNFGNARMHNQRRQGKERATQKIEKIREEGQQIEKR